MKKVLSLVLVICMLLTTLFTFASCSSISEDAVEKDAQKVLSKAWRDTALNFFDDSQAFSKIVAEAFKNGSVEIALQAELLEENADIEEIKNTFYFNEEDKKIASQTSVIYDGETLEALLFVDKNGITVSSESILGDDTAYRLNPATLAESFFDSDIVDLIFGGNLDSQTVQVGEDILAQVADVYKKAFATSNKDAQKNINALLSTLDQSVGTKEIKNSDGKSVKCIVTAFELNNDNLIDFIEKAIDIAGIEDEYVLEGFEELTSVLDGDEIDLDLEASIYINQSSGLIEQITIKGDAVVDGSDAEIDAILAFSDEKIELNVAVEVDGEEVVFVASIEKEVDGKETTYTITAEVEYDDVSIELVEAEFVNDKDSGEFKLTIKSGEYIDKKIVVNGTSKTEKGTATIQINSIKYGSTTVDIDLTLTFKKSAKMPKVPGEVKDIVDLTEEDFEEIYEAIQDGVLGDLY